MAILSEITRVENDAPKNTKPRKGGTGSFKRTSPAPGRVAHLNGNHGAATPGAAENTGPIQSLEAEQATIGAVLMEAEAVAKARAILKPDDFYRGFLRVIFEAACAVADTGTPVDLVTVFSELKRRGTAEEAGGDMAFLTACIEACPGAGNVEAYAREVAEAARRREAVTFAHDFAELAHRRAVPLAQRHRAAANHAETMARAAASIAPRFALVPLAEIMAQVAAPALIDGLIPADSLFALVGPSGAGKSFVALDWALSVATGRDWKGRGVTPGSVVFITPEGRSGFKKRIAAWCIRHAEAQPENFFFVTDAPQLAQAGDVDGLLLQLGKLPDAPALIVIDTVARHMVGGDENAVKDMGLFVAGADKLRATTGAAVLMVHHTGKDGMMRGSTALRGAVDGIAELKATGEKRITLSCDKGKDAAHFDGIGLIGRVVELEAGATSLVFDLDESGPKAPELSANQRNLVESLAGFKQGATFTEWKEAAGRNGIAAGSFARLKAQIEGFICRLPGDKYQVSNRYQTQFDFPGETGGKLVSQVSHLFRGDTNDTYEADAHENAPAEVEKSSNSKGATGKAKRKRKGAASDYGND